MINKTLLIIVTIGLLSCKDEALKDYVIFSGKITNSHGNKVSVKGKDYSKEIKMNDDGTFSDTLHLKLEGIYYTFSDGNEQTSLFLKNGDAIKLTLDTKEFDETVKFTGVGSETNNYLAQKMLLEEKLFTNELYDLKEEEFDKKTASIKTKFLDFLTNSKNIDTSLVSDEKESINEIEKMLKGQYAQVNARKMKFAALTGKPSPEFNDYENYDGTKTSLKDLKGKVVYIDVWATWCGPCRAEIPFLQTLEKDFHGKNIAFVSISVDKAKKHDAWKKMIADKKMSGIQLFAGDDDNFVKEYKVNSIPRFILIGADGNVINPDASRPSEPNTKEILAKLIK